MSVEKSADYCNQTDSETKEALEGAVSVICEEDIVKQDGKVIVKADTQIERTVQARMERLHLPLTFRLDSIMSKRLRPQRAM